MGDRIPENAKDWEVNFRVGRITEEEIELCWKPYPGAEYKLYWSDHDTQGMQYRCIYCGKDAGFSYRRSTHIPHYFRLALVADEKEIVCGKLKTVVNRVFHEQLERLGRGLAAMRTDGGIFLTWRLMRDEVTGHTQTGLGGTDFCVLRNGKTIAVVRDSTNYLDVDGTMEDVYEVRAIGEGEDIPEGKDVPEEVRMHGNGEKSQNMPQREAVSEKVRAFPSGKNYYDIPICRPAGGVTPAGERFEYHANDMSVGDVDGDGDYEYIVKWDPDNSKDVSQSGYTGHCIIDCYKWDGTLLWRLDLGPNIRAGAHYTQFMVFDFDGDGRAEVSVKTAPGSRMLRPVGDSGAHEPDAGQNHATGEQEGVHEPDTGQNSAAGEQEGGNEPATGQNHATKGQEDGEETVNGQRMRWYNITLPPSAAAAGVSHADNYVCSAADYREHLISMFMEWQDYEEVRRGEWPGTIEECLGIVPDAPETVGECPDTMPDAPGKNGGHPGRKSVTGAKTPLSREDAGRLVDYFLYEYAPSRSEKNRLWEFEGFVYEGPEFLTMFYGDGREAQTIDFPFPRVDDGLRWGDYAMERIEPCNRVDRFLSGVAYLDGEHPSLIVCRGYYTRTCIAAYDFLGGKHRERFLVDSGFVPMKNPFCGHPHTGRGSDKVFGALAGQGNHSLATADIDGDGCQEIIYGAAVIDHDGSLKYSGYGKLPDGREAKLGHGDAMHVAKIDPDRPGYEIFHVFEGAEEAPYGYALCDAETGEVLWGKFVPRDLGRCMVGDIARDVRGLQCFVNEVFDCKGRKLDLPAPGTNQSVRYAADLSTQFIDGPDYVWGAHEGIINDLTHGTMLVPEDVRVNNGTKGNPCLVADILGDFREEVLYRRADDGAIRVYFADEVTTHKLFTLMHDTMYRTGVAWQNNCYNQPCYTKFYFASDMDFGEVY